MSVATADPATWRAARLDLLQKEKELTRARDALAAARRALPRYPLSQSYTFAGPEGPVPLSDLFGPHGQLAIYHFMFDPAWEEGCTTCSFWADHLNGITPHLAARDVALALVSAAPMDTLAAYKARMGWDLTWVSSAGTTFNRDMGVSFTPEEVASGSCCYNYGKAGFPVTEAPGLSIFTKEADGTLCHSYSTFARGLEGLNATYQILDMVPKGRNEAGLPFTMAWLRRHDSYTS